MDEMDGVNKEGNRRGLCFTPRWGVCKDCGAPIWKDAAKRQLCASCRARHEEIQQERNRMRARESYYRRKKEQETKPKPEKEYECKAWRKCRYGYERGGCAYVSITGNLRTSGGAHPIIDGKCDLFDPRKKKRGGWHDVYAADGSRREE